MGEAARRKRARRAGGAPEPDGRASVLIREIREALVARARDVLSGIPDEASGGRVHAAASEIERLLGPDGDGAGLAAEPAARSFLATVGSLAAIFAPADHDAAVGGVVEDAAEQLMAFEELPLGSRLGAVANDRDVAEFVAAASVALGPRWDPLDPDPYGLLDLGALSLALAAARAFLLTWEAAGDPTREDEMRGAIEGAGALASAAHPLARDLAADDLASPAWAVARAVAANSPDGTAALVRQFAPHIPLAFAAGACGSSWLAGTDSAELFERQCADFEAVWQDTHQGEVRDAVQADPLFAAYAAGRAFAASRGAAWRAPWDLPTDGTP